MEVLFMDITDKLELVRGYKAIQLMANLDGNRELLDELYGLGFDDLLNMEMEYRFFLNLHKQSKYDNILSLMKIFRRLGVEMPNIRINLENIDETYDKLWGSINDQITISDEKYSIFIHMMETIVYDDELNHPNTKRKLRSVLRNLNIPIRPQGLGALFEYDYVHRVGDGHTWL